MFLYSMQIENLVFMLLLLIMVASGPYSMKPWNGTAISKCFIIVMITKAMASILPMRIGYVQVLELKNLFILVIPTKVEVQPVSFQKQNRPFVTQIFCWVMLRR
ncbi:hypothetical protein D3C87_1739980 [compost metagenome]